MCSHPQKWHLYLIECSSSGNSESRICDSVKEVTENRCCAMSEGFSVPLSVQLASSNIPYLNTMKINANIINFSSCIFKFFFLLLISSQYFIQKSYDVCVELNGCIHSAPPPLYKPGHYDLQQPYVLYNTRLQLACYMRLYIPTNL